MSTEKLSDITLPMNGAQGIGLAAGVGGGITAVDGYLSAGRGAVSDARRRVRLMRYNTIGQSNDLRRQGRQAASQAEEVLASYQLERGLRADKATRQAAAVTAQFAKSGVSLDSDSVRAIQEDQATQEKALERLHARDNTAKVNQLLTNADEAEIAARNTEAAGVREAMLTMDSAYAAKAAYQRQAIGSAFQSVSNIAGMFA